MTHHFIIPQRLRKTSFLALTALTGALFASACSDDAAGPGTITGTGGEGNAGETGSGGDENGTGGDDNGSTGGSTNGTGGVGGPVDPGPIPDEVIVSNIEDLADKSHPDDYGANQHGVISGGRLALWYNDWANNRPRGITGKLVILQIVPSGTSSSVPIAKEEEGVFVYLVPAAAVNAPRDNGVSQFETDIPTGEQFDAFLKLYDIDPRKDLIVLSFESQANTTNAVVHSVGRAWIYLRYWGVAKEHVAILNGSLNYNSVYYGLPLAPLAQQRFSAPPDNGQVTARHLGVDNTILAISLEELIDVVADPSDPVGDRVVRIVDARGGPEAYGLKRATSTGRTDCDDWDVLGNDLPSNHPVAAELTASRSDNKCSTPFEGRIKGAESVPWTQFVDTKENGFRYLSYATVKQIFDSQSGWNEDSEISIQYCRTNQRSTVTGIVANVILGYPTRFYETSFIEWGHLSWGPDPVAEHPNKNIVPLPNFWLRTDLDDLTEHAELTAAGQVKYPIDGRPLTGNLIEGVDFDWVPGPNYNAEGAVSPVSTNWPRVNLESTTSRQAIDEDRAYLRGIDVDDLPEFVPPSWGQGGSGNDD